LSGMAYGKHLEVSPKYIDPAGSLLSLNATIFNPNQHSTKVYAIVYSADSSFTDSLELFNDGLHGDGEPNDNIFGGDTSFSDLDEDIYSVTLFTTDFDHNVTHRVHKSENFTTVGPVLFDHFEIFGTDTIVNPGERLSFKLALENLGSSGVAKNITAKISTADTMVNISDILHELGDILPGESVVGSTKQTIRFRRGIPYPSNSYNVSFAIDIFSDDILYWSDTTSIVVGLEKGDRKLPGRYSLFQNYPNPFNPSTTIEYFLTNTSHVNLSIYNSTGQKLATLISAKQSAGNYKVEWNAADFSSGIYYYRLETDQGYSQSRKLILLK